MSAPAPIAEALAPMEVPDRLVRLRASLAAAGISALLVTKLEHLAYLTGFSGSAGMLLVREASALLLTDGRYRDQAAEQAAAAGVEVELKVDRLPGQLEALAKAVKGVEDLALEADDVSWGRVERFAELFEGVRLSPTRGLVEELRQVKDDGEIARIERACAIADIALAQTKEMLLSGCSEAAFAAELDHEMIRRGASGPSFETIVASGPNSAFPHARPTDRPIGRDELIVVDFGAIVDGYHSDMTRTLCIGEPPGELQTMVEAVLASQRSGLRAVVEGASCGTVDAACRDSLSESGYGDAFLHGTGHGVGLEIHEGPALSQDSADILRRNSVVTVEPGAYLHGRGGARIEDTVVVTDRGARLLTKSTKDYLL